MPVLALLRPFAECAPRGPQLSQLAIAVSNHGSPKVPAVLQPFHGAMGTCSVVHHATSSAPAPRLTRLARHGCLTQNCVTVQGERMWEFAVALLLLDVVSNSIFLVGAYGFGEALVTMLGGAQVGRWIDTTDRLVGASRDAWVARVCTAWLTVTAWVLPQLFATFCWPRTSGLLPVLRASCPCSTSSLAAPCTRCSWLAPL